MSSPSSAVQNAPLKGIALMVVAVGLFALMDTIAKYLARSYPVPGIVWARYVANFVLLTALLAARGELRLMRTRLPGIQVLRGALLAASTFLYFTSLKALPMAEAAAIGFVLPLFVAVLSVPMLGERLDAARMVAIFIGLAGALLVVRPGSAIFTPYAALPAVMAFANALYQILTRKIAGVEPPLTSLFYGALVGTVAFSFVAPFAWVTPSGWWHWTLIAVIGALATAGHFVLIRAFDYAPATLLSPFVYTQLVWVMILGFAVFGDFPDAWALTGMGVIVASGLALAARQRLAVRKT
jgi:drug/metabolite transporter (DMT)-like permease